MHLVGDLYEAYHDAQSLEYKVDTTVKVMRKHLEESDRGLICGHWRVYHEAPTRYKLFPSQDFNVRPPGYTTGILPRQLGRI